MTSYPDEHALEAAAFLKQSLPVIPETGIITGSGLGGIVDDIENPIRIPYIKIPHFPVSSIPGHAGDIVAGHVSGKPLVALSGRVHYYEGHPLETVVFPMQVMAAFGVKTIIVTNAAGAVNNTFSPGDIIVITDHMDLMRSIALQPLTRPEGKSDIYDPNMRNLARRAAEKAGVRLKTGVYAAVSGPSYETPAEIRALRMMGADMVGMSTVPEATEAQRLGMTVLGLSFITNLGAGMTQNPLSHQEVIETSGRILPVFKKLIKQILKTLT